MSEELEKRVELLEKLLAKQARLIESLEKKIWTATTTSLIGGKLVVEKRK